MRRLHREEQRAWMPDILAGLDETVLKQIRAESACFTLSEGEAVPTPHACAVWVASGLVRLSVVSDDRAVAIGLHGAGDTLCAPLFDEWDVERYRLDAQECSEVWLIPRETLLGITARHPEVGCEILRQLSGGYGQLLKMIQMIACYDLPTRIAKVLVSLSNRFGFQTPKGVNLGLRITQSELAEFADARRETLNVVLQELREREVIDTRYAQVLITDFQRLQQLANPGAQPLAD